jgi:NhaA family Na+:H+ antiporter
MFGGRNPMTGRLTWLESDGVIPSRFARPARRFMQLEAASGLVLLAAAAVALLWANLPFGESYDEFWGTHLVIQLGPVDIDESLRHVVNDALMTFFFFVVGLEIKRETRLGDLKEMRAAAGPAIAAVGGMVVPALIFFAFNSSGEAARGWAIPMATDIAFALGVVALLGNRIPQRARLFLLALAIVDDIGAIVVIAIFYTDDLALGWLVTAVGLFIVVYVAKHSNVRAMPFYWIVGAAVWFAVFESGVHATLAGVALGFLTPTQPFFGAGEYDRRARAIVDEYGSRDEDTIDREHIDYEVLQLSNVVKESVSPLTRLEEGLHPWTSFLIVPLFALANAGVRFAGIDLGEALTHPVTLGVAGGLVVGKLLGISAATYLAVRSGVARLPSGSTWHQIGGLAALGGIGFTVALFITELAFDDPALVDLAKIGIFIGSAVAGIIGYLILRRSSPADSDGTAR